MLSEKIILRLTRDFKRRVKRNLLYRPAYPSLHPLDYSRAIFRAKADEAIDVYYRILGSTEKVKLQQADDALCHPAWRSYRSRFAQSLLQGLSETFLDDPVILPTMVRRGWAAAQKNEQYYLVSRKLGCEVLANFKESRVGEPHLECCGHRCSSNSLGHLYYLVRMLEAFPFLRTQQHSAIEVGGGYGNFCRIYTALIPSSTYFIIDFPEFLALQYLFLTLNKPGAIYAISGPDFELDFTPGSIYLLPVHLLPHVRLDGNLFISHFALSESTTVMQRLVTTKRFFGCEAAYVTGKTSDSDNGYDWPKHAELQAMIRGNFDHVKVEEFHMPGNYEVIARSR